MKSMFYQETGNARGSWDFVFTSMLQKHTVQFVPVRLNVTFKWRKIYLHNGNPYFIYSREQKESYLSTRWLQYSSDWNETLFILDGVIMGNPFISLQSPWAGVFHETITLFSLLTAGEWGCLKAILQDLSFSSYAWCSRCFALFAFWAHSDRSAIVKYYLHKLRRLKMLMLYPLGQLFLVGLGIKNGS